MESCTIDHTKPEASQSQLDQCMRKTITEMMSPLKCADYFTTVASDKCSIQDVREICMSDMVQTFTVEEARSLCKAELKAKQDWWMQKGGGKMK